MKEVHPASLVTATKNRALATLGLTLLLLVFYFPLSSSFHEVEADTLIKGQVNYRKSTEGKMIPDRGAKIWLFSGKQQLALDAAQKLANFEKEFPKGGTDISQEALEDEVRKGAMLLMVLAEVNQQDLSSSTKVDEKGNFTIPLKSASPVTLIIESAAVSGSYHLKRYYVEYFIPEGEVKEVNVDFGISHFEEHH